MNTTAYLKYISLLTLALAITISILSYATFKNKFSKKMSRILTIVFIIDALLVLLVILKTWL